MNESQWLATADPMGMVYFLDRRISERQLRLFACLCLRRIQDHLGEWGNRVLGLAERLADGRATGKDVHALRRVRSYTFSKGMHAELAAHYALVTGRGFRSAIRHVVRKTALVANLQPSRSLRERISQAQGLREIVGNPFRPADLEPAWLRGDVVRLARGIYEEQAFEHLPVLADALEEAGCEGGPVLEHFRGAGPHIRGCRALDLVLGLS